MTSLQFSPFKSTGDPICHCGKIGQGQPRVIIYMHFQKPESPILHAKFQNHRTSGSRFLKVFTIYGHGGHLGHVT